MHNQRILTAVFIAIGLVFLFVAYIYASHAANTLPSYFPGYQTSSDHIHTKHALATFLLAIGSFVLAWFQSGPKNLPNQQD